MKNEEKKVKEIKKENSGTVLTEEELKTVTGGKEQSSVSGAEGDGNMINITFTAETAEPEK